MGEDHRLWSLGHQSLSFIIFFSEPQQIFRDITQGETERVGLSRLFYFSLRLSCLLPRWLVIRLRRWLIVHYPQKWEWNRIRFSCRDLENFKDFISFPFLTETTFTLYFSTDFLFLFFEFAELNQDVEQENPGQSESLCKKKLCVEASNIINAISHNLIRKLYENNFVHGVELCLNRLRRWLVVV